MNNNYTFLEECILPDFIQARRLYGQGASELKTATGIKLTGEGKTKNILIQ